jgi:hypothetical protein
MAGQKDSGGYAGCPAGTDARPAFISVLAGAFSILQFGINLHVYICHLLEIKRFITSKIAVLAENKSLFHGFST